LRQLKASYREFNRLDALAKPVPKTSMQTSYAR